MEEEAGRMKLKVTGEKQELVWKNWYPCFWRKPTNHLLKLPQSYGLEEKTGCSEETAIKC